MIPKMSIELKMIAGAIFFTLLLAGLERYEFSQNIVQQFLESKKGKNQLLINTISPVIGLNISLGLEDANQEYLTQIVRQNPDLISFKLSDAEGKSLYRYSKETSMEEMSQQNDGVYHAEQSVEDPVTGDKIATVSLHFDDHEYQAILRKNKEVTLKIIAIALVVLLGFIFYIKREFKFLKKLSEHVMQYDPHINNFTLTRSERNDEVGIIHNAIVAMVDKINTFATQLDEMNRSLAAKVEERTKELREANLQLQELSTTDPLTKLPNRRYLENHIQNIWELAKRNSVAVSIIMCDIDYFKQVNDRHGHIAGDMVLKQISHIVKNSLKRSTDFIARYGGEEFIIVLYDTEMQAAETLCTMIQENLKSGKGFEYGDVTVEPVTMSFGIGSTFPRENTSYQELVDMADTALYQAKKGGRNRFVSMIHQGGTEE